MNYFTLSVRLIFYGFTLPALTATAQTTVEPDPSFGSNGQVHALFGVSSRAYDMHVLPDDRILLCGIAETPTGSDALLARFLPDGDPDTDFGLEGSATPFIGGLYGIFWDMYVDESGNITACGKVHIDNMDHAVVAQFTASGQPVESFGNGGYTTLAAPGTDGIQGIRASSITRDSEGRWVLAADGYVNGVPRAMVIRLNSNGTPDNSFGESGYAVSDITLGGFIPFVRFESVGILPDGSIIASGFTGNPPFMTGWLAKFDEDGNIVSEFGTDGNVWHNAPYASHEVKAMHILDDGRILCAGNMGSIDVKGFMLSRHMSDGSNDNTFGAGGYCTPVVVDNGSFGYAILPPAQPGGPWIVAGNSGTSFSFIQVSDNGMLDMDFGWQGRVSTAVGNGFGDFQAIGRQSNGKIVAAGFIHSYPLQISKVAILRYTVSNPLSSSVAAKSELLAYPNPTSGIVYITSGEHDGGMITDLSGRSLLQVSTGARDLYLDNLPAGTYLLKLQYGDDVATIRVVKQ